MALPPGPSSSALSQTWQWLRHPYEFLDECARRYGDTFHCHILGFGHVAAFTSPECIKEIYAGSSETFAGGKANAVLRPFVGANSVLVLDGEPHHRQRKLLMPALHGERMHAYGQAMLDLASESLDSWPLDAPFALHARMQDVTLRIILRTIFGVAPGTTFDHIIRVTKEAVEIASNPLLLFHFMQLDLGRRSPWGRFLYLQRQIDDVLRAEVDQRRSDGPDRRRNDVFAMLIEARDDNGAPMTFQELRDELVTMLVAGHETTATALAWSLSYLLRDPELCAQLRSELGTATEGGRLVPERVAKLELLDATVREALRIRPVAPMVGRILQHPIKLGGYDIPAGWAVAPVIYLAHRRSPAFPEPERFDPRRFLRGRPTPNEWLPFGGGIRRCIGAAFASYEMKMVLATVLSRAELQLRPGYEARAVRRGVTLAPLDGVPVTLSARRPARLQA